MTLLGAYRAERGGYRILVRPSGHRWLVTVRDSNGEEQFWPDGSAVKAADTVQAARALGEQLVERRLPSSDSGDFDWAPVDAQSAEPGPPPAYRIRFLTIPKADHGAGG